MIISIEIQFISPENHVIEKVRGESMVEVLTKFMLKIAQIEEKIKEEALDNERMKHAPDDDIPF